jgi:pimeloyl-ACP methyl ester carboxylesterase
LRRPRTGPLYLSLLAGATLLLAARPAPAQQRGPKEVDIVTADFVTLKGYFYPGESGKPTVVLLHALGEDCNKAEWISLAKKLNGKGYHVLRFDFRGHGQSTAVVPGKSNVNPELAMPGFYDFPENRLLKGAAKRPATIDAKMFTPGYLPVLANDLEAIKAWLDAAGADALVLIGAKDGATVGALWLNAQWNCFRVVRDMFGQPAPDRANPEGKNVAAAVWLSMAGTLGNRPVSVAGMLSTAALENNTPMWFLYAPGDTKAKATATKSAKALHKGKKGSELTAATPIKSAEKLSGSELLARSLGTQDAILKYLSKAVSMRKGAARPRGQKDAYVWQFAYGGQIQRQIARNGERLIFFNFAPFLR